MAKRHFPNGREETWGLESDAGKADRLSCPALLCQLYAIQILSAFGSRAREALEWVQGKRASLSCNPSDMAVGVKPYPEAALPVGRKVELAFALEDLFGVD